MGQIAPLHTTTDLEGRKDGPKKERERRGEREREREREGGREMRSTVIYCYL